MQIHSLCGLAQFHTVENLKDQYHCGNALCSTADMLYNAVVLLIHTDLQVVRLYKYVLVLIYTDDCAAMPLGCAK